MSKEHFVFPSQRKVILDALSEQRKCGQFCDVTFVVGSKRVVAHRSVVAAASSYFQAMFASGMRESTAPEVPIDGLDCDAFESIIDFFYTSSLACDEDCVEAVLRAAHLLQVTPVIDWCCGFLQQHLDPGNCLGVARLSDALGCGQLGEAATEMAADRFADVAKSEEFLSATVETLKAILAREDLCVESETDLFEALMTWVRHDVEARESVLGDVLAFVRLPLLGPKYLSDVVARDPLVGRDERCCAQVADAGDYLKGVKENAAKREVLFAGEYITSNFFVSSFGPDVWPVSWRRVAHPLGGLFRLKSMAAVGGRVYVQGDARMDAYDVVAGAWAECRPPGVASDDNVRLVASTSRLYCTRTKDGEFTFCGYDAELDCWSSDSVRFEVEMENYWSTIPVATDDSLHLFCPYSMARYHLTPGLLQMSVDNLTGLVPMNMVPLCGRVYGAFNLFDSYVCNRATNENYVRCYDPIANAWSSCGDLTTPKAIRTLVACNRQLYAVCTDYPLDLCRIHGYEPATDSWTLLQAFDRPPRDPATGPADLPNRDPATGPADLPNIDPATGPTDLPNVFAYAITAVSTAGLPQDAFGVECSMLRRRPKRKRVGEAPRFTRNSLSIFDEDSDSDSCWWECSSAEEAQGMSIDPV